MLSTRSHASKEDLLHRTYYLSLEVPNAEAYTFDDGVGLRTVTWPKEVLQSAVNEWDLLRQANVRFHIEYDFVPTSLVAWINQTPGLPGPTGFVADPFFDPIVVSCNLVDNSSYVSATIKGPGYLACIQQDDIISGGADWHYLLTQPKVKNSAPKLSWSVFTAPHLSLTFDSLGGANGVSVNMANGVHTLKFTTVA